MLKSRYFLLLAVMLTLLSFAVTRVKPVLYVMGDSTVKNGSGSSDSPLQGWGSYLHTVFDTSKLSIQNHAIGGRSSRTFLTEGRWDRIMASLQKGDYVIMQFGHNDGGPLDDTARARGTLKGTGDESKEIYNPIKKQTEVVHTYGWYMTKYIQEARSKGAIPIICSPIPRNDWKDGKVLRSNESYALWAKQIANNTGTHFIDLHNILADEYEKLGKDSTTTFFPQEHTHTNKAGAVFNATIVAREIKGLKKCKLSKYLQ